MATVSGICHFHNILDNTVFCVNRFHYIYHLFLETTVAVPGSTAASPAPPETTIRIGTTGKL